MIVIKNLKKEKPTTEYDVKIDRSTLFGNPYSMKNEEQRDCVCEKFELYFYKRVEEDISFKKELFRLYNIYKKYEKLNLYCWCEPFRCHGETIRKYLLGIEAGVK